MKLSNQFKNTILFKTVFVLFFVSLTAGLTQCAKNDKKKSDRIEDSSENITENTLETPTTDEVEDNTEIPTENIANAIIDKDPFESTVKIIRYPRFSDECNLTKLGSDALAGYKKDQKKAMNTL